MERRKINLVSLDDYEFGVPTLFIDFRRYDKDFGCQDEIEIPDDVPYSINVQTSQKDGKLIALEIVNLEEFLNLIEEDVYLPKVEFEVMYEKFRGTLKEFLVEISKTYLQKTSA